MGNVNKTSITHKGSSRDSPTKRRILIVEDHPLMRRGLTELINNEPDLEVCAAVANQQEGIEEMIASSPDLVITDLSMKDGDGLTLIERIRSGNDHLLILLLTMYDAPDYTRQALNAGANGYVSKQEPGEILLLAIRFVLNGETYLSPKIKTELTRR